MRINYRIFNPTGNITALVTTSVKKSDMPKIAEIIMENEPDVQQVGYVSFADNCDISLTMAGGEFCGNATLCAAYICAERENKGKFNLQTSVSDKPSEVIGKMENGVFYGSLKMPNALKIENISYTYNNESYVLPTVEFSGITHIIVKNNEISSQIAENAIKQWAKLLNCDALGILFFNEKENKLIPLVYVTSANTLFWESSCASGTTAVGVYLSNNGKTDVNLSIKQPAGSLGISVKNNVITLFGTVVSEAEKETEVLL